MTAVDLDCCLTTLFRDSACCKGAEMENSSSWDSSLAGHFLGRLTGNSGCKTFHRKLMNGGLLEERSCFVGIQQACCDNKDLGSLNTFVELLSNLKVKPWMEGPNSFQTEKHHLNPKESSVGVEGNTLR